MARAYRQGTTTKTKVAETVAAVNATVAATIEQSFEMTVAALKHGMAQAGAGVDKLTIEDIEIYRTVELLGGRRTLHRAVRSRLEAHDLLQEGLPGPALKYLVTNVIMLCAPHHGSLEKAVGISLRTYQRRKDAPEKKLSPEQSGRAWKFAEILGRAIELFGSQAEAEAWLERPAMALEQRKPIDLLSTPAGVESVEDHLTRLEYGVYT